MPSTDLSAPILQRLREATSLALWQHGAVQVRVGQVRGDDPFRLASGNFSPIYVDCRRPISDPVFLRLFTATSGLLLAGTDFDVVAGGETAGIPYAAYLAQAVGKPMIYLRKKAKGYGTTSRVEGALAEGSRVLLVEDLITDGGSKVGFLDAIRGAGCSVTDAVVLFDRQQGGGDLLAGQDVRLHAVTDRTCAMDVARAEGLLDDDALASVEAYFADPAAWHEARGLSFGGQG